MHCTTVIASEYRQKAIVCEYVLEELISTMLRFKLNKTYIYTKEKLHSNDKTLTIAI